MGEPDVHQRSHRVVASNVGSIRRKARLHQESRFEWDIRSDADQQGPEQPGRKADQFRMNLRARVEKSAELALSGGVGSAVSLSSVSKVYGTGSSSVRALENVSIDVGFGEFLCLVGASGCGKSTLLNLVAGLDQPTTGRVNIEGGRPTLIFQ